MKDNDRCVSLNYEAKYHRLCEELEKQKMENHQLRDELKRKEKEVMWLRGIRQTVEVIFGREFHID